MTQGLITVLLDGKVAMKIVTGCNGMYARKVAKSIRKLERVPTIEEAYEIAIKEFDSKETLVVLDHEKVRFDGEEELSSLYRSTFDRPRFNPRWDIGICEHISIVKFFI
ncbi:MAG: hypothetical protein KBD48_00700 [Candidatus Pacebacteria bacterium]|nr:hypothetical protein [Candidatus Paceibacterota bacterium]MBP9715699.1 hypothetical protein [Candidatus Paceibacterota bacterium]